MRPIAFLMAVVLLLAMVCLLVTLVSMRSATPYEETQIIAAYPKDYQTALSIASTVAEDWDSGAKLVRADGIVDCAAQDQFTKGLHFEFGASKFFFGFPRVSFARVTIEPTTNSVKIVAEPTDMYGQPATMESDLISLDLDAALLNSSKNGGAEFLKEHPNCLIGFSLYDYIWRLRYAVDLNNYRSNNLRFEIDSRSGELLRMSRN